MLLFRNPRLISTTTAGSVASVGLGWQRLRGRGTAVAGTGGSGLGGGFGRRGGGYYLPQPF